MKHQRRKVGSPAWYIPSLYFIEGLPNAIVNMMSVVLLKNLHFDNSVIGFYTSLLYIPWTIKFVWAPFIDLFLTRRKWILVSHMMLMLLLILESGAIFVEAGLAVYLIIFALIAFVSATQDIAIDGYYMDVLKDGQQAAFVGVRNAAYKVAWLFGSGALVSLAGYWMERAKDSRTGTLQGWALSFFVCALVFGIATLWHFIVLPRMLSNSAAPTRAKVLATGVGLKRFGQVFSSFSKQPRFSLVVLYILTFRMGDAFLLKMAQPFLLDPIDKGGLALTTAQVGLIYGTAGVIALLLGGIVGGILVSRFGLKRCMLPAAMVQNSAIILYWFLSILKPSLSVVAFANGIEQFAYGLGTAAYTVFLLSIVKPEFKAAHYAIATAIMAIGLVLPGALSGFLVNYFGYEKFFLFSFFSSIPGIICILYLPVRDPSSARGGKEEIDH